MEKIRKLRLLSILFSTIILLSNFGCTLEFPIKAYIYQEESWKIYDFEPYDLRCVDFRHIVYDSGQLWIVSPHNTHKMVIKTGNLFKVKLIKDIRNIYKDKKGILWISTLEKLYKVKEGKIVEEINWPNEKWFETVQVIEDNQGNLWFLSYKKIIKYDKKSWKLILYPEVPKDYLLKCFAIDNAENIYISCYMIEDALTDTGKECIMMRSNSDWVTIYEHKFGSGMGGLSRFIIPFKEYILVSFIGMGIYSYKDKKFEEFGTENVGSVVYCAKKDKKGNLWLGTDKGLMEYDYDNKEFKFLKNPYPGIKYYKKTNHFEITTSQKMETVYDIDFDSGGNVWFSSGSGVGVYKLSEIEF